MKKNDIKHRKKRKRKYFCIVKQISINKYTFRVFIIGIFLVNAVFMHASETSSEEDSIICSLITCSPYEKEIYSLYGHTAIRYKDLRRNQDWVFNYGVFNFKKPFFALRFALGLTDYELGAVPYHLFIEEYKRQNRTVTEQVLNLNHEEKIYLFKALVINLEPDNREYRYNYFTNNCTTKARDMIERCIEGTVYYFHDSKSELTYRKITDDYTAKHPWARFCNNLCLGLTADTMLANGEWQFLPDNLKADFSQVIVGNDSMQYQLVVQENILLRQRVTQEESSFVITPWMVFSMLLLLTVLLTWVEFKRNKHFLWLDVSLWAVLSVAGILLTVLFFSKHPTTSTNLQILILNPIPLFFLHNIIRNRPTRFWKFEVGMIILFLIGAFFQEYAEGMLLLALCLLIRCVYNISGGTLPKLLNRQ